MTLGRTEVGGDALMILSVDQPVSNNIIDELKQVGEYNQIFTTGIDGTVINNLYKFKMPRRHWITSIALAFFNINFIVTQYETFGSIIHFKLCCQTTIKLQII